MIMIVDDVIVIVIVIVIVDDLITITDTPMEYSIVDYILIENRYHH